MKNLTDFRKTVKTGMDLGTALLHLPVVILPFIIFLQNKHTTLPENGENFISAHSQGLKI